VKLAQRAGVPIVPFALDTGAWGIGKWISDMGRIDPSRKVRFAFGEPMTVHGRGAAEHQAIVRFISNKLAAWREEILPVVESLESDPLPETSTQPT
jgi:1-acyl-sn-glycerol-3-phosphate acyltransferase